MFVFPVASPFRLRVSHHFDRATFPVPATSNAACGFPTLRSPACFTSRVMGPMLTVRIQVIDGTGTFTLSDSQPCRLLTSLQRTFTIYLLPIFPAHRGSMAG